MKELIKEIKSKELKEDKSVWSFPLDLQKILNDYDFDLKLVTP